MDFQVLQLAYRFFLSEKRIVDSPPTPAEVPITQSPESLDFRVTLLSAEILGKATNGGTKRSVIVHTSYTASLQIGWATNGKRR